MNARELGIHSTHCCVIHGCKYGDKDCPVVNTNISQVHPCEDCYTLSYEYEGNYILTARESLTNVPVNQVVFRTLAGKERMYHYVFVHKSAGNDVEIQAIANLFNSKDRRPYEG